MEQTVSFERNLRGSDAHLGLALDARWNGPCYGFLMASLPGRKEGRKEGRKDGDAPPNSSSSSFGRPIDRITNDAVTFSLPPSLLLCPTFLRNVLLDHFQIPELEVTFATLTLERNSSDQARFISSLV